MTAQLVHDGWQVNHKRVLRIMRQQCLLCVLRKRWVATTDSSHGLGVHPNRLKEVVLTDINQAWVPTSR